MVRLAAGNGEWAIGKAVTAKRGREVMLDNLAPGWHNVQAGLPPGCPHSAFEGAKVGTCSVTEADRMWSWDKTSSCLVVAISVSLVGLCIFTASAFNPGDTVGDFTVQDSFQIDMPEGQEPEALTSIGQDLFVLTKRGEFEPGTVWRLNVTNQSLDQCFSLEGDSAFGLASDGQYLWVVWGEDLVQFDTMGNATGRRILDPPRRPGCMDGVAWSGSGFWLHTAEELGHIKLDGTQTQRFWSEWYPSGDLAFHDGSIWTGGFHINRIDARTGDTLDFWQNGTLHPCGIAFIGDSLWVIHAKHPGSSLAEFEVLEVDVPPASPMPAPYSNRWGDWVVKDWYIFPISVGIINGLTGLGSDGDNFWIGHDLWCVDVVSAPPAGSRLPQPMASLPPLPQNDFAWDGTNMWAVDAVLVEGDEKPFVFKLDRDGKILDFFQCDPAAGAGGFDAHVDGLAWDGEHLWAGWRDGTIRGYTRAGAEVANFCISAEISDLAWYQGSLWAVSPCGLDSAMGSSLHRVAVAEGTVVESFDLGGVPLNYQFNIAVLRGDLWVVGWLDTPLGREELFAPGDPDEGYVRLISIDVAPEPTLSWLGGGAYTSDGVDPDRARHMDWYGWKVRYSGSPPTYVRLHLYRYGVEVAGSPCDMNPGSGNPVTGRIFWLKRRLCKGTYTYRITASDGVEQATGQPTQQTLGPIVGNRAPRLEWAGEGQWTNDPVDPQGST